MKWFGIKQGAESHPLANFVNQLRAKRDSGVQIAPPTAFPLPEGINRLLAKFLAQYEAVIAAYLVQMIYLDNPDMSPEGRPCLTLCVEYEQPENKALHDQISIAAQAVIDGRLGQWGFIDIIAVPDILRVASATVRPFYMKQK